jgi:hypothetical protein
MPKEQVQLDPAEYEPVTYVAGYVIAKLYQLSRTKKGENSKELQSLLQSIKSSDPNNYISVRGGGRPCYTLQGLGKDSRNSRNLFQETCYSYQKWVNPKVAHW